MSSKGLKRFKPKLGLVCSAPNCGRWATSYTALNANVPAAADHLSCICVLPLDHTTGFLVCRTCLEIYAGDPSLWPVLKLPSQPRRPHHAAGPPT